VWRKARRARHPGRAHQALPYAGRRQAAANPARVPQARQEGALLQRRAEAAEAEAAAQRAAARRDLRRAAREAADAGEEAARARRGGAFAPPLRCARPLQPAPACGPLEAGGGGMAWGCAQAACG